LGAERAKKSGLKPGVPLPGVRLPDNFVARPEALAAVKERLLVETEQTLVVSAIAGLGGLGKSVLATAVVLDAEVQARFADGILWVTLGQNPDLQNLLGDWIRMLDKSREAFSANTLEAASMYLGTLLAERRMLLVVDDVWNGAHSEWFRVGGVGCRVLVTTREARLVGADYYDLDLMSEDEAIELLQKKLRDRWQEEDLAEVKAFARVLGYLPLALNLAVNQVRDGLNWGELRLEFEAERKSIMLGTGRRSSALKLLDSSEAWELLDENEQRKYSLQACFNLSLKRLSRERFEQFAWLGVLPEDVDLTGLVAAVLWDVPLVQAKKVLIDLRNRSFLTSGVESVEGELSYRVHDLMHDMARGAINLPPKKEQSKLGGLGITLPEAHREFLERYRYKADDKRWDKLPKDGYIHRHLTWHMMQANWNDEIHELMAMSDERGRNAWFEACECLGQPTIFVRDISRAWKLTEELYKNESTRAIVLQCRYALITATLNSFVSNLSIEMMAEFVKRDFWRVEQAWSYVEQMQDEEKIGEAIKELAPFLSKSLIAISINKVRSMKDEYRRAQTMIDLSKIDTSLLSEALSMTQSIKNDSIRAKILRTHTSNDCATAESVLIGDSKDLAGSNIKDDCTSQSSMKSRSVYDRKNGVRIQSLINSAVIDSSVFPEALSAARSIQDQEGRAVALSKLANINENYFSEALIAIRNVQSESNRGDILIRLNSSTNENFSKLVATVQSIKDKSNQAKILGILSRRSNVDLALLLSAAQSIQDRYSLEEVLKSIAKMKIVSFSSLLTTAKLVLNDRNQSIMIDNFIKHDKSDFTKLIAEVESIQDEYRRTNLLIKLCDLSSASSPIIIAASYSIQDENHRVRLLKRIISMDSTNPHLLLKVFESIESRFARAKLLVKLAIIDSDYFSHALEMTIMVENEDERSTLLTSLSNAHFGDSSGLLIAIQAIQNEKHRSQILSMLIQNGKLNPAELLILIRSIKDELCKANIICCAAKTNLFDFHALSSEVKSLGDEKCKSKALISLAKNYTANSLAILSESESIKNEEYRGRVLVSLAMFDTGNSSAILKASQTITSEEIRALVLSFLARVKTTDFFALLAATQRIENEFLRVFSLKALLENNALDFSTLLSAAQSIRSEEAWASLLISLAKVDKAEFSALFSAAQSIHHEERRVIVLNTLVTMKTASFPILFLAAKSITSECSRASILSELASMNTADFSKLFSATHGIHDEKHRADVLSRLTKMKMAKFSMILSASRYIQDENSRANVLISLSKMSEANFLSLLSATRFIQDEKIRTGLLESLSKMETANFSALLSAAKHINNNHCLVKALLNLAGMNSVSFTALLLTSQSIQDEKYRAKFLSDLAKSVPNEFVLDIQDVIRHITIESTRARVLSSYICCIPLSQLPYSEWHKYLHLLAYSKRSDLMEDLVKLHPAILHLGGETAMRGVVDTMKEVCDQWK
jgi:uncharacterized protein YigA (DUF484 family)